MKNQMYSLVRAVENKVLKGTLEEREISQVVEELTDERYKQKLVDRLNKIIDDNQAQIPKNKQAISDMQHRLLLHSPENEKLIKRDMERLQTFRDLLVLRHKRIELAKTITKRITINKLTFTNLA